MGVYYWRYPNLGWFKMMSQWSINKMCVYFWFYHTWYHRLYCVEILIVYMVRCEICTTNPSCEGHHFAQSKKSMLDVWRFPEIGGTPKSSIPNYFNRLFFSTNHLFLGLTIYRTPRYATERCNPIGCCNRRRARLKVDLLTGLGLDFGVSRRNPEEFFPH